MNTFKALQVRLRGREHTIVRLEQKIHDLQSVIAAKDATIALLSAAVDKIALLSAAVDKARDALVKEQP